MTDYRYVFFPCKDYETLDDETKIIIEEDTDIKDPSKKISQIIWHSKLKKIPENCEYMGYMIDNTNKKLVGVAKAKISSNDNRVNIINFPKASSNVPLDADYVYISNVDIHPNYMGKSLCKPFLKWFISQFNQYNYFYIVNAANYESTIPACMCYLKAGLEGNYKMFYLTNEESVKEMTISECDDPFKLPGVYYYVKDPRSMNGSGKINKKNNKKTNKKTNRKRKHKSRKNKKNKEKKIFSMKLNTYPRVR